MQTWPAARLPAELLRIETLQNALLNERSGDDEGGDGGRQVTQPKSDAKDGLADAVRNYFALWDRCGGSEAVAAEKFAEARYAMRAALRSQSPGTPT
jgi:hypothetical protein